MKYEAESFGGTVGRTVAQSDPWWPKPRRITSPDVILVVLDDVGFGHLGCYGSVVETPNIDELANAGLRFTNFHTTALCSPTRACLLTGRNHHTVGMSCVTEFDTGFPNARGAITKRAATVAEVLADGGFGTYAVGKWHLTPMAHQTEAGPFDQRPLGRGFGRYFGFLPGVANHWEPELWEDNHRIRFKRPEGYHLSEDMVDHSISYIRDHWSGDPDRPYFLYLAFGACHSPHHAPAEFIEPYRGRFDQGWDRVRQEVFERQVKMGVIPPSTELAPRNPGVPAWDQLSDDERRIYARMNEVFAGYLSHTDYQIGRLVAFLREAGKLQDTLIMLLSDNGASQEGGPTGTFNEMRVHSGFEETIEDKLASLDKLGGPESFGNYPWGWAQAGNTPLKWYKQNTHGGGIRDPLIVHWPARITETGTRTQYHHAVDVMPTILDVAGTPAPDEFRGVPQLPVAGTSMTYCFDDPDAPGHRQSQYFEMLGNRGIWHRGWKAVTHHVRGSDFDQDVWELYHLDEDFSEMRDLAAREPKKLAELVEMWWTEAGANGVLPIDDRLAERMLITPPGSPSARNRFRFYQGMARASVTPPLRSRAYSMTVSLSRPEGDEDGVLLSCGTRFAGQALFVQDDRLVYEYNHLGLARYVAEAASRLGPGPATVSARFTPEDGREGGRMDLVVEGRNVGGVEIPVPFSFMARGWECGTTGPSAVSARFEPDFDFSGVIHSAVLELAPLDGSSPSAHDEFDMTISDQ